MSELAVREKEFHDKRFSDDSERRQKVSRFYSTARKPARLYKQRISDLASGKKALEFGCGLQCESFNLGDRADCTAIDISPVAIQKCQEKARSLGLPIQFSVMDAHQLTFEDNSFDVVFGCGILHHLQLEKCMPEIARVLKPGGHAVFLEPLGHNPLINGFRNKTPTIRTPDEHPLLRKDFIRIGGIFESWKVHMFGLSTLGAAFLHRTPLFKPALGMAEAVDSVLLRLPGVRWLGWQVVIDAKTRADV